MVEVYKMKLDLRWHFYFNTEPCRNNKQCTDLIYCNEKFLYENVYNGQQMTPMRRILEAI